jgi:ADP-ribose pyrophosphatase YjhB (NUDIX family)
MTEEERRGAIWAVMNKFPVCYPTVDMAVVSQDEMILLGRKKGEKKWRLPGGFVDPGETFESAAYRELAEETGLSGFKEEPKYLGSYVIDDSRYRGELDNITTSLWLFSWSHIKMTKASDDLEEVKWFKLSNGTDNEIKPENVIESHQQLIRRVLKELA